MTSCDPNAKIDPPTAFGGATGYPGPPSLPLLYRESDALPPINPGLTIRDLRVSGDQRWRVAHVKSRAEKQFAWDMLRLGMVYFLPLVETYDRKNRNRVVQPAFTSYVFFCGDSETVYAARATNRVCQIIEVVDQSKLVKELENLQRAAGENGLITGVNDIRPGAKCRVKMGHHFENMEGEIEKDGSRGFVWLRVTILGDSTPVEIAREHLELID